MTEYSKGSRSNMPETVQRTYQPTNMYSNNNHSASQSRSRYSQHPSNGGSSFDENEANFQLGMPLIMPLVQAIKDQNQHLKQQKKQMENQMASLHKHSHYLLNQNQQLRKHYAQRTNDIRKLVDTISINTNQQISDVEHQSFLLKQSNIALAKKIQQQIKTIKELDHSYSTHSQAVEAVSRECFNLQQYHRDLAVKNRQLSQQCSELQFAKSNQGDLSTVQSEINQTLHEVTMIKILNQQKCKKAKDMQNQHLEEQPQVEQNCDVLRKQLKDLTAEANNLKSTAQTSRIKQRQTEQMYQKTMQQFAQAIRHQSKHKNNVISQEQSMNNLKSQIKSKKQQQILLQTQLQKLKQQKQLKQKAIANKKASIKEVELNFRQSSQNHKDTLKKQSDKIRGQQTRQTNTANNELTTKIQPQMERLNEALEHNKEDYGMLAQQISQFQDSISKLDNPTKQIIRLQYQIKKLSSNKK